MVQSTSSAVGKPKNKSETLADAKRSETITGLAFLTPAVLILFVFLVVPLLMALYFSFTNWSGSRPLDTPDAYQFIGFDNYQRWIIDGRRVDDFYRALRNTAYYVIGVVPIQTFLALILAVIVNQKWLRGRGFFRTAFYFPAITSSIVVSFIFLFLFSANGPINSLLHTLIPSYESIAWTTNNDGLIHILLNTFGIDQANIGAWAQTEIFDLSLWEWLSGPSVAMSSIMALAIWTTTGTLMVIYLAALQNIPGTLYEASQVDGATPLQQFRFITLPLLRPTTFFVITLGLIGTFQVFDQIYVIQNDQTQRTTTSIAYLVYDVAFDRGNLSEASAIAIVLFLIIFIATLLQRTLVGGDRAEG